MQIVWVALFGLIGVFSRYGVDQIALRFPMPLPYNTLGINILGSFLAGMVYVLGVERGAIPPDLRTGILVGFLGGFTTFSAYALQSAMLFEKRELGQAFFYLVGSPLLGLAGVLAGLKVTRAILN